MFGGNSQHVPVPAWGEGITQLGFLIYPTYRLEVIGIIAADPGGALAGAVPHLDRPGGARRASRIQRMVGILGINVRRTFLLVSRSAWSPRDSPA